MVPTLQCGFVLENFCFAIFYLHLLTAHNRIRTDDPILTKNVLYLLSYVGTGATCNLLLYIIYSIFEKCNGGGRIRTCVAISGGRFTVCSD